MSIGILNEIKVTMISQLSIQKSIKEIIKMKFMKSVIDEMKIVTWPTKTKLTKDVITVIQSTLLFAAFFWVADLAINAIMQMFV